MILSSFTFVVIPEKEVFILGGHVLVICLEQILDDMLYLGCSVTFPTLPFGD